jgi:hypothetical protein
VFDDSQVAKYWPEFQSKDSGLMKKKKLVPNLPKSINYLKDLHEDYKLTTTKQRFFNQYSSKTNDINGTYNHQIQMFIKCYICFVNKKLETEETVNKSETVNLGKEKKQTPKQQLKDAKTALLKKDYELKMKY